MLTLTVKTLPGLLRTARRFNQRSSAAYLKKLTDRFQRQYNHDDVLVQQKCIFSEVGLGTPNQFVFLWQGKKRIIDHDHIANR
jgi:hypothetical protein